MSAITNFREPYQSIYESFCFRDGLADNDHARTVHQTFNGVLRDRIRGWIKAGRVPNRDEIARICDQELTEIERQLRAYSPDYEQAPVCPRRLDAVFAALEFTHTSQQHVDQTAVYIFWRALISAHELAYDDMRLLREHFGGGLDTENEMFSFNAARVIAGPRFLHAGHQQMPPACDQVIARRARAVLNQILVEHGYLDRPLFRYAWWRRWRDNLRLNRIQR